jgi:putative transposase
MIEAWWRFLKHQWLFLHSLESVTTVRGLVALYVHEHNRVLPRSRNGQTTPILDNPSTNPDISHARALAQSL